MLQRLYGDLIEDYSFSLEGPEYFEKLTDDISFEGVITGENKEMVVILDEEKQVPFKIKDKVFSWNINTKLLEEGMHDILIKTQSKKGTHYWDFYSFRVENTDDPPTLQTALSLVWFSSPLA